MGKKHKHYLQQSLSSGNILHEAQNLNAHRVHFSLQSANNSSNSNRSSLKSHDSKSNKINHDNKQVRFHNNNTPFPGLQRSKSLGAADMKARRLYGAPNTIDLGNFPPQIQATIFKALEDPNQLSDRNLMELVRCIMERVLESRKFAEPGAKLCIKIIEKEKKETFLESLLNTCQQWYQERNQLLKGTPNKFPTYMAFLNEMYCQVECNCELKTHHEGVPPGLLLLTLLCKKQELPKQLDALLGAVRDAFLTAQTAPNIRKTLLQLIELSAARWQLSAPAVMYYYPGTPK
ncbi:hypothetical protein Phum_PHUM011900 [Pediculus humanus corporis]|uniref:MIF4G domain-containing protein n=1 Tax=Pediculus humanus subsp. corporis TaxID=121224 RepID=E0V9H5_PEDHC|nr:uncharacterized protein Phum_PHUM011900 [Pediculus humanus corporis]EEB10031.1 hypothetical protein Phum_PHUM011900 [Pediculus humanus corporis]